MRDYRVQRVAAVLWKLVNRLDPALVGGDPEHQMLRAGAEWTVHVIDSPEAGGALRTSSDAESPPPPPRVCMLIRPEAKSCSNVDPCVWSQ